jgi:hypothetical protein
MCFYGIWSHFEAVRVDKITWGSFSYKKGPLLLKPHCIRCSHFKVDDVSALEAISKLPVHIAEDNVTASLHPLATYAMTLVTAWMP